MSTDTEDGMVVLEGMVQEFGDDVYLDMSDAADAPAPRAAAKGAVPPILKCDKYHRIKVKDIIGSVNKNHQDIHNLTQIVNNINNNYAKLKTRRNKNILYMTDDGTNP